MHWDHVDVIGLIDLQVVPGQKEPAFGFFHAGWFMPVVALFPVIAYCQGRHGGLPLRDIAGYIGPG